MGNSDSKKGMQIKCIKTVLCFAEMFEAEATPSCPFIILKGEIHIFRDARERQAKVFSLRFNLNVSRFWPRCHYTVSLCGSGRRPRTIHRTAVFCWPPVGRRHPLPLRKACPRQDIKLEERQGMDKQGLATSLLQVAKAQTFAQAA